MGRGGTVSKSDIKGVFYCLFGCHLKVVRTTVVMITTHREDIPAYRIARAKYIPNDDLPVSTLILCSGLADPVFRIEVEVIATVASTGAMGFLGAFGQVISRAALPTTRG